MLTLKAQGLDAYRDCQRCWHDAEDLPPALPHIDPLMRPLSYGEVGVAFVSRGSQREILHQSALHLLDRTLQPGDYCKRSFDDVRAGVVTNIKVKGRVAHAISGAQVEGWLTLQDLEDRADAEIGDYVTFDDWVGQVCVFIFNGIFTYHDQDY